MPPYQQHFQNLECNVYNRIPSHQLQDSRSNYQLRQEPRISPHHHQQIQSQHNYAQMSPHIQEQLPLNVAQPSPQQYTIPPPIPRPNNFYPEQTLIQSQHHTNNNLYYPSNVKF